MRDRVIDGICGIHRVIERAPAGAELPGWAKELTKTTLVPWIGGVAPRTEAGVLDWADGMPNALFAGSGPYLPTETRLRKDVMLDRRIPAALRARLVVENIVARHVEDFIAERRAVFDYMHDQHATAEEVTRAAYWEPEGGGILDYALLSFGELRDEASQRRVVKWFLANPMRFIPAIDNALEAKRAIVAAGLMEELKAGSGPAYQWSSEKLTQYHAIEAVPMLAGRLGDADARVREWTAAALCLDGSAQTVKPLLAAYDKEKDQKSKAMELLALEQTGDVRAEGVLLAATKDVKEAEEVQELCRGLARMKSEKGLGFIAGVALHPPGDSHGTQTQWEAVEAFGYISGAYDAYPPGRYGGGGAIEPKRVEAALPVIAAWEKAHGGG